MINKCCQEVLIFDKNVINEENNIGPKSFRNYFDKKYKNLIIYNIRFLLSQKIDWLYEKGYNYVYYYIRISNDMVGGSTIVLVGGRRTSAIDKCYPHST